MHWRGWELPKGTIEKDETDEQTILREIREETSLENFKIIQPLNKNFRYKAGNIDIIMKNVFLVQADMNEPVNIHQSGQQEHDNYSWVTYETALKMLTWSNARNLLKYVNRKFFK